MCEKRREAGRRHYAKNKEKVKTKIKKYKAEIKNKWLEYKKTLSCSKCGASHHAIIDFHHIDPTDPTKQKVNDLVRKSKFKQAHEEIKKCLILCSNCHRILHWEETHNNHEM